MNNPSQIEFNFEKAKTEKIAGMDQAANNPSRREILDAARIIARCLAEKHVYITIDSVYFRLDELGITLHHQPAPQITLGP